MKKKTPRAKAKEAAWKAFSRYIRTRDCVRFTGGAAFGYCVTCSPLDPTQGRQRPFKELQAGHFIAGRGNTVLFDERIVYAQCFQCNGNPPFGRGGNHAEFFRFMLTEWTMEDIDMFRGLKKETTPYKTHDFVELAEDFKRKTEALYDEPRVL